MYDRGIQCTYYHKYAKCVHMKLSEGQCVLDLSNTINSLDSLSLTTQTK